MAANEQLCPDHPAVWEPAGPVTREDFSNLCETDDLEEIRRKTPYLALLIETLFPEPEP